MTGGVLTWIDADGDDLELSPGNGIVVRLGPVGLEAPPPSLAMIASANDGQAFLNGRHDARTVALPLAVLAANVRTVKADLARRLSVRRGPGELICEIDGRARRLRQVVYAGGLEGDETQARDDWALLVLSLLALDPMWYGDTVEASFGPPEGDQAYDTALPYDEDATYDGAASGIAGGSATYDAALPYDEAEPYDGGAIYSPALTSEEGAWLTLTFHGPATQAKALHLRTGEVVELRAGQTLGAGQDLVVTTDPRNRDITVDGQPGWDRVTPDSTASMMLLPGDQLALIMSGTSSDSYLLVAYDERWLTP